MVRCDSSGGADQTKTPMHSKANLLDGHMLAPSTSGCGGAPRARAGMRALRHVHDVELELMVLTAAKHWSALHGKYGEVF